jgi:uncharacterized membrane protein YfcA
MMSFAFFIVFLAAIAGGIINTIAGGGAFLTLPALIMSGLDLRAANITSTLVMFPMQATTGYMGRGMAGVSQALSMRSLVIISLIGGMIGAGLLLLTPKAIFAGLLPWLILAATGLFTYGSFIKKASELRGVGHLGNRGALLCQFLISIYGGYFGGGISFLMLAALTLAGVAIRQATATKNILAAVMNTAAIVIFAFSSDVGWAQVGIGAVGSVLGGLIGMKILNRVNERALRIAVVAIGLALTAGTLIYNRR